MTKTILITGAGHGFAKNNSLILAEKGHHVIATAEIFWPQSKQELKGRGKSKKFQRNLQRVRRKIKM